MTIPYLKRYALRVLENGYDICFIRPGEKRPFGNNWEAKRHGEDEIEAAIEAGRGDFGVGIKTHNTAGFDIDCYDEEIVERMAKAAEDLVGPTIQRVGLAPKRLLVYRVDEPFSKVQSKVFIDDEGRPVKLEILSSGQQFVAFNIHPDTGEPYKWVGDGRSVLDVPRKKLPPIDRDDSKELVAEFERLCRKKGWEEKSTVKRLEDQRKTNRELHFDDPFITDKAKVELSTEQLHKKLMLVPNCEDHDTWFQVGMALYHQYEGSQEGLDLWHEWSSPAHNYDMDALDERWKSFEIEGKGCEPLTARLILKLAKEEEDKVAGEKLDEIKTAIRKADDERAIQAVMDEIKHIMFPPLVRESLIQSLKDATKRVLGTAMSVGLIRRSIAYENPEHKTKPAWLRNWVYIQQDDTFYNSKTRNSMSTKGFDLTFGRLLLTKKDILEGKTVPEHSATHVALHRYQIPSVANRMYAPMEDEFFTANGLTYVNSYSDASVPDDVPENLTPRQKAVCDRIERHVEHLFGKGRDGKLLLSFMAYIVQTNGKINWAPVVQGVEGDGKSFFGLIMAAVLGGENVNTINGHDIAENFTPWAEGSQFCVIEEVRLHGQDRYQVINKLKPYITNLMCSVRRMRTDSYKVLNTVNYFLTTNHKDGVPVNENSSRYLPLFSQWQTKRAIDAFKKAHPRYYPDLYEVVQHPGWVRRWLLDYELHEDFNPDERAPEGAAMAEMQFLNSDEADDVLEEILDREEPGITRALLDSSKLGEAMADAGCPTPYGRAWKRMLSEKGFSYLGQVKIDNKTRKFWSQTPRDFMKDGKVDPAAVRDALDPI